MPLAYGIKKDGSGLPDPEGQARLRRAVEVGIEIKNDGHEVYMILAAGKSWETEQYGAETLAYSARRFLEDRKLWNPGMIQMYPRGFNTATELLAARVITDALRVIPYPVTSDWHRKRVSTTAIAIFGRYVRVTGCQTTLLGATLASEIRTERRKRFFAFPQALMVYWKFHAQWQNEFASRNDQTFIRPA
jgi:hypothetical protein